MANIITRLPSQHEKILKRAYDDLIFFGKLFLPGDFRKSTTPKFHYEVAEELNRKNNKPLGLILPRGHAKHIRLDQVVLTKRGWVQVRNLRNNDYVFGSDGNPKKIVGLSDIVYKDIYEIILRDGRSILVSGEHLWTVRRLNGYTEDDRYTTLKTVDMLKNYHIDRVDKRFNTVVRTFNYAIDNPSPINLPENELPLDPYLLGLIIGDGSISKESGFVRIHSSIDDYEEIIGYLSGYDIGCIRKCKTGKGIRFSVRGIGKKIKSLKLNVNVYNKFIPDIYLQSSINQRLELLRGLMDTDGCLSTKSSNGIRVYFSTVSYRLAKDVVYLVRSLGGSAKIYKRQSGKYNSFNISIKIGLSPFKLKRKSSRFVPHNKLFNAIVSIRYVGKDLCRCLIVDSDDSLFVARDFILTHNSTLIKCKIVHDFVFAKKAYEWGFQERPRGLFIAWVSSSQKKSKNNTSYVKLHLDHNDRIKFYFGKLRGDVWNQEDVTTIHGDRLISSSNLSSIRGDTQATIQSGALRFTNVYVDDAENEDNTRTAGAREKITDIIMNGILPAIDPQDPWARLVIIGTPVHYDSFIARLLDQYNRIKDDKKKIEEHPWKIIAYPATQPNMPGGVLWPSWMPKEKLDEIKRRYALSPRGISGYYQEYELEVQSRETALWTRDHLRFWNGYYTFNAGQSYIVTDSEYIPINTFLGCDPATDIATKHSDYSVIMVIGVDINRNIYVIDYVRERGIPTLGLRDNSGKLTGKKGVVDYIIEMYQKYHCLNGTVEDVAMNRSVFQSLMAEKRRLGIWSVSIIPEKPGGKEKMNRIYSELNARFSGGQIHVRENHFDLIDEILKFGPKMAHDDTLDALYYACKHSHPIKIEKEWDTGEIIKRKRKAKPWLLA